MLKSTSKELFLIAVLGSEVSFDNPAMEYQNINIKQKEQVIFMENMA